MPNTAHRPLLALVALVTVVAWAGPAQAVCFKLLNETNVTLRGRVHDRGSWRPWRTMPPHYWACFASGVKRTEHTVQLDYRARGRWHPLYRGDHGSRMLTRVIHVLPGPGNSIKLEWYDEPPGCRAKPPLAGHRAGSCLRRSGSWWKLIGRTLLIVLQAATQGA